MIKAYKYQFYKIYKGAISNGEENPELPFSIALTFLGVNLLSLMFGFEALVGYSLPIASKPLQLIILGAFIYFNYSLLLKNGEDKNILSYFQSNPPIKEGTGTILIIIYMISSIIFAVFTANLFR